MESGMERPMPESKPSKWRWLPALVLTLGTLGGGALAMLLIPDRVGTPIQAQPPAPPRPLTPKATSAHAEPTATTAPAPTETIAPSAPQATTELPIAAAPDDEVPVPANPPPYVLPPPPPPPEAAPPPVLSVNDAKPSRARPIRLHDAQ
jgi:hypothetical protein